MAKIDPPKKQKLWLHIVPETGEVVEYIDQIQDGSVVFRHWNGSFTAVPLDVAEKYKPCNGKMIEAAWLSNYQPVVTISHEQDMLSNFL